MQKILLFLSIASILLFAAACGGDDNGGYPSRLTVGPEADTILLPSEHANVWRVYDANDNGNSPDYESFNKNGFCVSEYEWLKVYSSETSPYDTVYIAKNNSGKARTLYLGFTSAQYMLTSDGATIKVMQKK